LKAKWNSAFSDVEANYLVSCSKRNVVCRGQIGTAKFCIKPQASPGCCDAVSHLKVIFEFPASSLYLKENEVQAWCEPRFEASFLSPEQLHFLLSIKLPKEDWMSLFDLLEVGVATEWLLQTSDAKIWSNFTPKTSPTSVLPANLSQVTPHHAPDVQTTPEDVKSLTPNQIGEILH